LTEIDRETAGNRVSKISAERQIKIAACSPHGRLEWPRKGRGKQRGMAAKKLKMHKRKTEEE
jgi:hypothetical protein